MRILFVFLTGLQGHESGRRQEFTGRQGPFFFSIRTLSPSYIKTLHERSQKKVNSGNRLLLKNLRSLEIFSLLLRN
jgi:hypothetical protein